MITMSTKTSKIRLVIDVELLFKVWKTRKSNQTIDSRIEELIVKGFATAGTTP